MAGAERLDLPNWRQRCSTVELQTCLQRAIAVVICSGSQLQKVLWVVVLARCSGGELPAMLRQCFQRAVAVVSSKRCYSAWSSSKRCWCNIKVE